MKYESLNLVPLILENVFLIKCFFTDASIQSLYDLVTQRQTLSIRRITWNGVFATAPPLAHLSFK